MHPFSRTSKIAGASRAGPTPLWSGILQHFDTLYNLISYDHKLRLGHQAIPYLDIETAK